MRKTISVLPTLWLLLSSTIATVPLGFAAAPVVTNVYTYGAFVSGGAIITLGPANNSGNESATVEIKPAGAPVSAYAPAHPFTRFDGNNLATSFFELNDGVTYDLRITVTDPDSSPTTTTVVDQLTTKPEFVMPAENCTTTVNPGDSLQAAVDGTAHGCV